MKKKDQLTNGSMEQMINRQSLSAVGCFHPTVSPWEELRNLGRTGPHFDSGNSRDPEPQQSGGNT